MTIDEIVVKTQDKKTPKKHSTFINFFIRLYKEKPLGTFGLVVFLILFFASVFADLIAPYDIGQINLAEKLQGPSWAHWLGTDQIGGDLLSNLIYGARMSLIIGVSATALQTAISLLIGSLSAWIGGVFDLVVQRIVDSWQSIPGMLILLTVMSILGAGVWQIILAIGIPGGIGGSRLIRSTVLGIRGNPYFDAAKVAGSSMWYTMIRHILPNISQIVIISFAMHIGGVILMESSLSFLGFGVDPGTPTWGSMLSLDGRKYMLIKPALAFWPGFCLALTVYGVNMFGDAMRDLLDPRLKGGLGRYGSAKRKIANKSRSA